MLFLIALKWRKITKIFFYYELITSLLEMMLPSDITQAAATLIRVLVTTLNFISDYFDFLPSLICIILQYPVMAGFHAAFYNLPTDGTFFGGMILNMITSAVSIWMCHICITKIGMIFVEAEVLREGNEQLLNNLEEGVIIGHEDNTKILFMNEAAKRFQSRKQGNSDLENSMLTEENAAEDTQILDQELKMFAYLEPSILKQTSLDYEKTINSINGLENYISIKDII